MKNILVIIISLVFSVNAYSASWETVGVSLSNSGVVYDWTEDETNGSGKLYPGDQNYETLIRSWNGAALDTTRNRLLFWGGGHSGYAGNEMYAFDFDTEIWSMVVQPDTYVAVAEDMNPRCAILAYSGDESGCTSAGLSWFSSASECYDPNYTTQTTCYAEYTEDVEAFFGCFYEGLISNGNPKTIHTYDTVDYYPQIDSWCSDFGAMAAVGCVQYNGPDRRCYSFTANTWRTDFADTIAGGTDGYGALDPITKLWYGGGGNRAFTKYDAATDTHTLGDNVSVSHLAQNYNKNLALDYRRNRGVLTEQETLADGPYYVDYEPFVVGSTRLGPNVYTLSGDSSWYNGDPTKYAGMDYDPVLDKMIMFDSENQDLYTLDTETGAMVAISATGTSPGDNENGTFSRFKYIPKLNKFALVQKATTDVFLLSLTTLTDITTATLNSTSGDTDYPLTIGQGFKRGDVPSGQEVAFRMPDGYILPTSYECKKTWNDSSCKHAIMSAIVPTLEADTDFVLDLTTSPDLTDGREHLSESDIVTAAPTATVSFTGQSWTTVDLGNLLGSPDRVFLAGPDVVEAHYHQDVVENSQFVVKFYVRYYENDDIWIRVGVENGALGGSGYVQTYTPTITIGSATVYNTEVDHYRNTRYVVEGWINNSHTDTSIKEETAYLMATGLVPNYWKTGASETRLDGLTNQTYTPLMQGDWRTNMAASAYHGQIGLLPNWAALYFSSEGDSRAYNAVIANAKALNTYPIAWRDPSTDMPIVIETGTDWDTWTVLGDGAGGIFAIDRDELTWELNHHGSGGYLAYMLSGDYYHLETMQYQSTLLYLCNGSAYGSGTSRSFSAEIRGLGWSLRTIGQLVSISPTEAISTDLRSLIDNWMTYYKTNTIELNGLGYFYSYHSGGTYDGKEPAFMQHFLSMSTGYLSDMEPFADLTNLNTVRDFAYKGIVGVLGEGGAGNYCFGYAADPYIYARDAGDGPTSVDLMYDTWGDAWDEECTNGNITCPDPITDCPNVLTNEGSDASLPSSPTSYWANLLPAIAYAVDDGATGAEATYARLTGASNWSDVDNAGYADTPVWGISPRGAEDPPEPGEGSLWGSDGNIWQFQ